jgi:site-specific DNA-methyltransferase (adenine-specific)
MTEFWYVKKSKGRFRIAVACNDSLSKKLGVKKTAGGYYRAVASKKEAKRILRWLKKSYAPVDVHKGEMPPVVNTVHHGDCLDYLRELPDNSIDLICTGPPYGINFKGSDWDKTLPSTETWEECLRILKPGSFAFMMCTPRQDCLSQLISDLEEVGFVTSFTSIYWTYFNGLPKAQNLSKEAVKKKCAKNDAKKLEGGFGGFQPKPAVEPVVVVMKPLDEKTYLAQVSANGKGCTWLGDCRIPGPPSNGGSISGATALGQGSGWNKHRNRTTTIDRSMRKGRFPANVLVSDGALGRKKSDSSPSCFFDLDEWFLKHFKNLPESVQKTFPYLLVPKAPKKEKNSGLRLLPRKGAESEDSSPTNTHPTPNPVTLMSYLVILGSRPGDIVLDPFLGSGTTGVAAVTSKRRFIGMELEEEYVGIAVARIRHAMKKVKRAHLGMKKLFNK